MPLKAAPKSDTLDWSGFYLGGHVGYAWGRSGWTAMPTGTNGQPVAGSLNFYQPFNAWDGEGSYFAGLQGGYNVMLPSRLVVGVETDVMAPNLVTGDQRIATAAIGSALYEERMFISGNRPRPAWLWVRQLAALCDRRLRLDTGSVDLEPARRDASRWFCWYRDDRAPMALALRLDDRGWHRVSVCAELDRKGRVSVHGFWQSCRDISGRGPAHRFQSHDLAAAARLELPAACRSRGMGSHYRSNTVAEFGRHCHPRPNDVHQPICVPISLTVSGRQ